MQTASSSRPIPGPSRQYQQDFPHPISPSPRYPVGSPFKHASLAGSFRSQFYPGCSPGMLMGPLDIPDFKRTLSTSYESEHGSLIRALNGDMPSMEGDMCRDYTCCGIILNDLHALVEHFEDHHVVVVESPALQATYMSSSFMPLDPIDDMDLDGHSSGSSSPSLPDTPVLPFDTTSVRRSSLYPSNPTSPRVESAFNRYSGYTEFSSMLPGTMESSPPLSMYPSHSKSCLPPALLNTPSPMTTPPESPAPSTTLSRPSSSLLLSKPFRCPKEGCNKSYKQANGLKYHIQHGSCNFTPLDPSLEGMDDKEAEKKLRPFQCQVPPCTRRYKNMNGLRYHYQHSGAHGAIGLALIASGQHEGENKKVRSAPSTIPSSPVTPTSTAPHTPVMTPSQQPFFSMQDVMMN